MLRPSLARPAYAILLLSLAVSGCASTASVYVWQPAEADVGGIRRLAVLDFRGPENRGQIARSALVAKFAENGFYELVDQGQLGPVLGANGDPDVNRAILAARAQGVDGLLVGDVVSYDVADDVQRDQNFELGGATTKDGKADVAQMLMGMRVEKNETINREVSVALSFQLIDVQSGRIVAAKQSAHTDIGTMTNGEGYLPGRDRGLTEMMDLCSRDIVHIVAPHQVSYQVDLATAAWGKAAKEIRAGNENAQNNDWPLAADHWEAALELDPDSHAAMHNLALARAAGMDYGGAERLLGQAIELKGASLYTASHSRVERHKQRYLTAMAQHDARHRRDVAPPAYAGSQAPPGMGTAVQHTGHVNMPTTVPPGGVQRR
jgi:curli biogenesis system outer membrane secretion channel CsgG